MNLFHYRAVDPVFIDNELAAGIAGRVVIGKGDGADHFCMRVFEIAPGGHTPRHTHDWEHELFIHSGTGEVFGNGELHPVGPGDVVFVPGGEEHQLRNPGDEPFIFVCLVPAGAPEL